MPQPAADGLIHSNGISTTNGLVIRAEDLAFSSKMESFTKRDTSPTSDTLFVVVQSLLAKYLLTLPEISAWLVEHPQVNQTQSSIEVTIRRWIESKFLLEYTSGHQPNPCVILPPPLNPPKNNRIQSLAWIYSNTQLNNRFQPLQKTYNNLIKHLDLTGHNSYNQTIDPVEFGPQVVVNNRICSMFSSNDYLGLSKHPSVVKAGQETYKRYGNSSSGSRIMTGTTSIHRKLEVAIADLKDCDDAVIFSSGFLANLALMSIFSRDTTIFFDSLNHACIIDGIRLAELNSVRFKHNNLTHLRNRLQDFPLVSHKVISVESVYSLDGDISPLPEIIDLAKQYNAIVVVDEAHSTGTMGTTGKGISEHFGLDRDAIALKMGTLGKALGGEGGYIAGPRRIIDAIRYTSRPYLFSTSLPAPIMAGTATAIQILNRSPNLPQELQAKSKFSRDQLLAHGFNLGKSETQIIPIIIPDVDQAHLLQARLQTDGFFLNAITYPAVPPKSSRLRLSINAHHSVDQISEVIDRVVFHSKKMGVVK